MERLPEEMVLMIIQYLTDKELANCCAVSRVWRDFFNVDVYWKSRCDSDLAEYLRDAECAVEPSFVTPEESDSGLRNLCAWRLNHMRQTHLFNNWRQGKHQTFKIPTNLCSTHLKLVCCKFFGHNFAVLYGYMELNEGNFELQVQLWDVTSNPIFLSEYTVPKELRHARCALNHQFDISGNLVILTEGDLVLVLRIINSHELQFKQAFHFSQLSKIFVPHYKDLIDSILLETSISNVVGPILVGLLKEPSLNEKLFVWNLESGKKLREQVYQNYTFYTLMEQKKSTENKVIVFATRSNVSGHTILIYDVTQLVFHSFSIHLNCMPLDCLLHEQILAVNTFQNLKMYNTATEQLALNIPLANFQLVHLIPFGNSIMYDHGHTLKLFKPINSDVELFFEHTDTDSEVSLCSVLCEKFFLFSLGGKNDCSSSELYFVEDKSIKVLRPLSLSRDSFQCGNAFSSKFLISPVSKLQPTVLHFW